MFDEEILLLIKEDKHKDAIQKYVDKDKFDKVEDFCLKQEKSLGLLTVLLQIYFEYYETNDKRYRDLIATGQVAASIPYKEKAEKYRDAALRIMRTHGSKNQLDPLKVIQMIPEHWELRSSEQNVLSFLSTIFDHMLTIEDNSHISKNLSKMEQLNSEHELNELKQAYLVIGDDSICKVCKRKLKPKNIRIFPNGGVFHQRCAKDPHEVILVLMLIVPDN